MIKNLKYSLSEFVRSRQVRIGGIAFFTALTILAVTLLAYPFHTVRPDFAQKSHSLNVKYAGLDSAEVKEKDENVPDETYPVYVTCGDVTVTVEFSSGTVANALRMAGYNADKDDFVEPAIDTVITETIYIDYTDIEYRTGTYTETIEYSTKTVYSSSKEKGYSKITTAGVNGKKEVTYTEKTVNGVSQGREITATKVLSEPVQAVKTVGTKVSAVAASTAVKCISTLTPKSPISLDANGNPVEYKSKMTVRATAYTYTGNNCSTGVAPQPGYIAVNPDVIPYGTKMYIKSPDGSIIYGYAVAADTGGFIKNHPTGIDLFMTTRAACTNFGVRNMEVYILN